MKSEARASVTRTRPAVWAATISAHIWARTRPLVSVAASGAPGDPGPRAARPFPSRQVPCRPPRAVPCWAPSMVESSALVRERCSTIRGSTTAARAQLTEVGAAALNLRAVARELGMASSAVYRYFPSRDDLLTRLIVNSYDDAGAVAEAADDSGSPTRSRWVAVCLAVRGWALAHPHGYALLYGSPVPGYAAPTDTVPPAARVGVVLGRILGDAPRTGRLPDSAGRTTGTISAGVLAVGEVRTRLWTTRCSPGRCWPGRTVRSGQLRALRPPRRLGHRRGPLRC